MNAKEFAHKLEKAASFIRQQQAEIEALKQIIDANNLNQNIGQFVKPTNEPVAWMLADKEKEYIRSIMAVQHDFVPQGCVEIPLYTHPVSQYKAITNTKIEPTVVSYTHPVKELTDEEINWLAKAYSTMEGELNAPAFARAILRKASEK